MIKKKLILFDFDGTIVDSQNIKELAFKKIYENYGIEKKTLIENYLKKNTGVDRFKKFEYINKFILHKEYNNEIGKKLSDDFSSYVLDQIINAPFISGAKEFLEKYHQKIFIYLFSATPIDELILIIKKRKMKIFFRDIFGSPRSKNNIFEEIIERTKVIKNQVLIVGDSFSDLEVAQKNDVDFIGISNKYQIAFPNKISTINNLMELEKLVS